jgi:hypothetical protein
VDGDEVRRLQQFFEIEVSSIQIPLGSLVAGAVVVDDIHAETPRAARDGRANAAHADDAYSLAPNVDAAELLGSPPLPAAGSQGTLGLAEAAGGGEQEHEGGIGGGLIEDVGGVGDHHAALARRTNIDIVVSHGHVGDDLQAVPRRVEDFAVDLLRRGGEDGGGVRDGFEEFVAGRRAFAEHGEVVILQKVQAGGRYLAGYDDLLEHQVSTSSSLTA